LKRKGEIVTLKEEETDGENSQRSEELRGDIDKLLDPGIPSSAFRISWIALGRCGRSTPQEIANRAKVILDHCAKIRGLPAPEINPGEVRGWMQADWAQAGVNIQLAWYRPMAPALSQYECVWSAASDNR
jgi:hypothetical protein